MPVVYCFVKINQATIASNNKNALLPLEATGRQGSVGTALLCFSHPLGHLEGEILEPPHAVELFPLN